MWVLENLKVAPVPRQKIKSCQRKCVCVCVCVWTSNLLSPIITVKVPLKMLQHRKQQETVKGGLKLTKSISIFVKTDPDPVDMWFCVYDLHKIVGTWKSERIHWTLIWTELHLNKNNVNYTVPLCLHVADPDNFSSDKVPFKKWHKQIKTTRIW